MWMKKVASVSERICRRAEKTVEDRSRCRGDGSEVDVEGGSLRSSENFQGNSLQVTTN